MISLKSFNSSNNFYKIVVNKNSLYQTSYPNKLSVQKFKNIQSLNLSPVKKLSLHVSNVFNKRDYPTYANKYFFNYNKSLNTKEISMVGLPRPNYKVDKYSMEARSIQSKLSKDSLYIKSYDLQTNNLKLFSKKTLNSDLKFQIKQFRDNNKFLNRQTNSLVSDNADINFHLSYYYSFITNTSLNRLFLYTILLNTLYRKSLSLNSYINIRNINNPKKRYKYNLQSTGVIAELVNSNSSKTINIISSLLKPLRSYNLYNQILKKIKSLYKPLVKNSLNNLNLSTHPLPLTRNYLYKSETFNTPQFLLDYYNSYRANHCFYSLTSPVSNVDRSSLVAHNNWSPTYKLLSKPLLPYSSSTFSFYKLKTDQISNITTGHRYLFRTKTNLTFSLLNLSLIPLFKLVRTKSETPDRFKYKARYGYYSFYLLNDITKTIFNDYKKITSIKFLKSFSKGSFYNLFSNLNSYNKLENSKFILDKVSSTLNNYRFKQSELFNKWSPDNYSKLSWLNQDFSLDSPNDVFNSYVRSKEMFMSRINFRRNYQKTYRKVRSDYNEIMSLKFTYQKQLTRYLKRFYSLRNKSDKHTHNYFILDTTVSKVLLYSQLLPDFESVRLFFDKKLVMINGNLISNQNFLTFQNDIVSVPVSYWYYVFMRWSNSWQINRFRKFNRLIYRKGLAYRYKVMKTRKSKSQHTPKWVLNYRLQTNDVVSYIEVDYFSLSAIIINEPYLVEFSKLTTLNRPKGLVENLYNWKYIT